MSPDCSHGLVTARLLAVSSGILRSPSRVEQSIRPARPLTYRDQHRAGTVKSRGSPAKRRVASRTPADQARYLPVRWLLPQTRKAIRYAYQAVGSNS